MHIPPRLVIATLSVSLMVSGAGRVSGQTASTGSGQATSTGSGHAYPNKPIRLVTGSVGGNNDFAARLIAPGLTGSLGQQLVVENRGGNATIPAQIVAQAPPDGYTLLLFNDGIWTVPLLQNAPYDPVKDFSPITLVVNTPNILVVHPSVPVKSVKDLVDLAKAKPGELNYASGGTGSSNHLSAELFNAMAGVNIVRISYKGSGPALNALVASQVQLMFPSAGAAAPHVKSGRVRALAVASTEPFELLPGLPTVAASGLRGYESVSPLGMFAPARTPATIVNRLNREIVRVLNRPDVKERLSNAGTQVVGGSPEQLATTVKAEMVKWGKVIKDAGIRAE